MKTAIDRRALRETLLVAHYAVRPQGLTPAALTPHLRTAGYTLPPEDLAKELADLTALDLLQKKEDPLSPGLYYHHITAEGTATVQRLGY